LSSTFLSIRVRDYHSNRAACMMLLYDATGAPAVLKFRIQSLLDMLKVNMSIHTIHIDSRYSQHEIFRGSLIPFLAINRHRSHVHAIQKLRPIPYRAKVLGRALLSARTDVNSFWMLLSGNAEVAFSSTTVTTTLVTNLPTPSTAGASANLATDAATAIVSSLPASSRSYRRSTLHSIPTSAAAKATPALVPPKAMRTNMLNPCIAVASSPNPMSSSARSKPLKTVEKNTSEPSLRRLYCQCVIESLNLPVALSHSIKRCRSAVCSIGWLVTFTGEKKPELTPLFRLLYRSLRRLQ
jgi:hypothetical protein